MSTDWFLYCVPCAAQSGEEFNHGEDDLASILAQRPAIEAAVESMPEARIQFEVCGRDAEFGAFFAAHRGHEVRVRNEYGDDFGSCAKRVDCAACGNADRCGLPRDHDPPCKPRGPRWRRP